MDRKSRDYHSSSSRRKRSRSREDNSRERPKLRKHSPSPSKALSDTIEFSFLEHKHNLNKILMYSNDANVVVNSLEDFWVFVKKYEATLRKAGKPILDYENNTETGSSSLRGPFSKHDCINFTSKMKFTDTSYSERDRKRLDKRMFDVFLKIVSIYLDFKNKEKFEKLKKLRKAQSDLPVAKYR